MWPQKVENNRHHTGIMGPRNISSCDHHGGIPVEKDLDDIGMKTINVVVHLEFDGE